MFMNRSLFPIYSPRIKYRRMQALLGLLALLITMMNAFFFIVVVFFNPPTDDCLPLSSKEKKFVTELRKQKILISDLDKFNFDFGFFMTSNECSNLIKDNGSLIEMYDKYKLESHLGKYKPLKILKNRIDTMKNTLISMTRNCKTFRYLRKYLQYPLSAEEQSYPIAYILTIHKNFEMFERLLRAIYHPQNLYCVHVDKKSPREFLDSVKQLSSCFENVFVASNLTDVHYTHWSRVEADLNCFHDLVEKTNRVPWKYVINLCGLDFPLKTNLELVRILKSFQGFNHLESFGVPEEKKRRYTFKYQLVSNKKESKEELISHRLKKTPFASEFEMFSGSAYYILKRTAVEFILSDPNVQKFLLWNQDTYSPDEHIWATLQRSFPQMPGSLPTHYKYNTNELQALVKVVKWKVYSRVLYPPCRGRYVRSVCTYGVGDLKWLLKQRHLFANKFDFNVDPFVIECLDFRLRNRTIAQAQKYLLNSFF